MSALLRQKMWQIQCNCNWWCFYWFIWVMVLSIKCQERIKTHTKAPFTNSQLTAAFEWIALPNILIAGCQEPRPAHCSVSRQIHKCHKGWVTLWAYAQSAQLLYLKGPFKRTIPTRCHSLSISKRKTSYLQDVYFLFCFLIPVWQMKCATIKFPFLKQNKHFY